MLCLALALLPIANVRAAELQMLAGGAMTGPLRELAAQFESASGHKLVFRFGTTPELIKLATAGGPSRENSFRAWSATVGSGTGYGVSAITTRLVVRRSSAYWRAISYATRPPIE